jgi:acyl-CoA synthetase (NDP forming)
VLDTIASDDNVDVMVPIVTFGTRAEIDYTVSAARRADKPFALLWSGGCIDQPELRPRDLVAKGTAVYRDVLECVRAVGRVMDYGQFLARHRGATPLRRPAGVDQQRAVEILRRCRGSLTERESKSILEAYGLRTTRERVVTSADQAIAFANEIGKPVALKISSPQIAHKTEAGGVRLDVSGAESIRSGYLSIIAAAKQYRTDAIIDGVLVQEMLPKGVELALGVTRDPVFGAVVMVALGGVHVEVLADVSYRIAPVSKADARIMIDELRGRKVLDGVRGASASDIDAICDAICRLSWLAVDLSDDVAEIDINPLIVFEPGAGCAAADALIVRTAGRAQTTPGGAN